MEGQSIPGDRLLDRYRIRDRFEGGMGVLWTVTDTHTGKPYAIKTIRPDRPDLAGRFRQEAQTWIALGQHEDLVQALWLIEAKSTPYLVLEFVEGRDLGVILRAGALPLRRALDLAMQCARGMAYAHARPLAGGVGIVHRDLKPSNLLITPDDSLKISDFGLARLFRSEEQEGVGAGTPAYTAPEQLKGLSSSDGRADIYSFGVVLYEMLAGRNPLASEDSAEQFRRVLEQVPPPLSDVPPALAALVARCIAKHPDGRPRDFGDLLAHLAQIARAVLHDYHVDPHAVPPPAGAAGLVVEAPVLRPRRPRTGLPFTAEVTAQGDFGAGPVEVVWRMGGSGGLKLLTPGGGGVTRLEAGGSARLGVRLHLVPERDGSHHLPESVLEVSGPDGTAQHAVPAVDVEVDFAFVLPLLGRETELERLRGLMRTGGALFVFGAQGSGRSRLLVEAGRLGVEAGRRVVASRAPASGLRPMRVLSDLASRLADDRRPVEEMQGLEAQTPPAHHWFTLLGQAAANGPLALLLDDLHNAGETAIRIVAELAARVRESSLPVAIVAACAQDPRETTARHRAALLKAQCAERGLETALLGPLAPAQVGELLDAVFAGHPFREEAPWLLETINRVTEGNPSHVAEILHLLRRGQVLREQREWHLAPGLTPGKLRAMVPDALEAALRARLDGLSAGAREVAEAAVLVGDEFDVVLLKAALGDEARVDAALAEMEGAEVVRAADAELDRYRFWSAAVPSLVRRDLRKGDPARRRRLHLAVAEAKLEVYGKDKLARRSLSIAHHLRAAGLGARSLPFTLAGCQRLLEQQLPERARRLLANAKPLVDDARRGHWLYLYGIACEATGEYEEGFSALTEFVGAGVSLPDRPRSLPRAYMRLGGLHRARGEFEDAQYCLGAARQLIEELGDLRGLAFVLGLLGELAIDLGRFHQAQELLGRAQALAEETGNEGAAIRTAVLRGRLALDLERLGEARGAFTDAARRASALGDRERLALALKGLGLVCLRRGYLERAQERLEQAAEIHVKMGDRAGLASVLLHLGSVHGAAGRVETALRSLRRAQRIFGGIGHPEGVAAARHQAGNVLRVAAQTTQAVRELAAAAETFQRLGLPDRVLALGDLGHALAEAGSERAARIARARADRASPNRARRVLSRTLRARLALLGGDPHKAGALARSALRQAARTTGHAARIAAQRTAAEVALRLDRGDEARRAADTVLAFAREQGDLLAAADAERVLCELAGRAGRHEEALERAHRAARAYTGRADAADGPVKLLLALAHGPRGERYLRAARACCARLEAQGFRPPVVADSGPSQYDSPPAG